VFIIFFLIRNLLIIQLFLQDFITKEYQQSVKDVLDNALQGSETANFEFPLYTKDRRRVEVLLNATTRRDVDGGVIGVIGVGQDITERKQVEIEKTRVAQELQTFIDTANAPIFGIDAQGLVNEWNNKAAAITGFSREEVLGKNLVQVTRHYID
jgi:PAS domain-containing protein